MQRRGLVLVASCLAVAGAGVGVAWWQIGELGRVDYEPGSAREELDRKRSELADRPGAIDVDAGADGIERDDGLLTTLVLGSDAREGDGSDRSDASMLFVLPPDGQTPAIASVPRDLRDENPCIGQISRINEGGRTAEVTASPVPS